MCFCIEARGREWLWIGPSSTDGFLPRLQARQLEAVFQKAPQVNAQPAKVEDNIPVSWKFPSSMYNVVWHLLHENHIACSPRSFTVDTFYEAFRPADTLDSGFVPKYLREVKLNEGQTILPFQSEGIKFGIAHRGRFLIGDEPGCGKTLQAIGVAHEYREDWPVLVIVPSSLRSVWQLQLELWGRNIVQRHEIQIIYEGKVPISPQAKFVVTSYELANLNSEKFVNRKFKFLICDEAHKIKNSQAQRTQTVTDLAKLAKRIILMTGTPIVNLATDVYQLFKILAGDDSIPSRSEFEERYFLKRERAFGKLQCSDPCREHELHALLESTIMIRRLKRDVLSQMPEKFRSPIDLDLALVQELKEFREVTIQGQYDALKQSELQRLFHATCNIKKEASATYVAEVIDCSIHDKYLVFAHHVEMLDTLETVLAKVVSNQGGSFIRICGKTAMRQRGELVNKFQTDPKCRVAILSITACAEGITLTAASNIIFAELHWTPAIMNQCEGRAHRMGQKNNIHIQYLLTPGKESVDHKAYAALTEKQRHCDRAIDGLEETRDQDAFPQYMKEKPKVLDNLEMSKKSKLFPKRLCRPSSSVNVSSVSVAAAALSKSVPPKATERDTSCRIQGQGRTPSPSSSSSPSPVPRRNPFLGPPAPKPSWTRDFKPNVQMGRPSPCATISKAAPSAKPNLLAGRRIIEKPIRVPAESSAESVTGGGTLAGKAAPAPNPSTASTASTGSASSSASASGVCETVNGTEATSSYAFKPCAREDFRRPNFCRTTNVSPSPSSSSTASAQPAKVNPPLSGHPQNPPRSDQPKRRMTEGERYLHEMRHAILKKLDSARNAPSSTLPEKASEVETVLPTPGAAQQDSCADPSPTTCVEEHAQSQSAAAGNNVALSPDAAPDVRLTGAAHDVTLPTGTAPDVGLPADAAPVQNDCGSTQGPAHSAGKRRAQCDASESCAKKRATGTTLKCLAKELPQVGFNKGRQSHRTKLRTVPSVRNARGAFGLMVEAERAAALASAKATSIQ